MPEFKIPEAAIQAINPMLDVASAETMLQAAYPHLRRAIIAELIAKAETGPADGTNDPHAAYWLRAELDGEG
jgi:hypothetical protein